jgi:hypothetical protein
MPSRLSYTSGTGRRVVEMDAEPVWVGTGADLRGRAWDYTLGYRGITGASRPAREVDLDAWVVDLAKADEMRRVFDRDVAMSTPGTLTVDGEWTQRAYVTAADVRGVYGSAVAQRLTVVLLDGAWRRERLARYGFDEDDASEPYAYLDYAFDYAYDYGRNAQPDEVSNGAYMPSPVRLVFFGPCSNPAVTIGGNTYRVNASVSAGGYIVVDGIDRAIAGVTANGTITNLFDKGVRGLGEGSGEYVFEPLPVGESAVVWDRGFAFDLYWYEEEGEPPWASQTA